MKIYPDLSRYNKYTMCWFGGGHGRDQGFHGVTLRRLSVLLLVALVLVSLPSLVQGWDCVCNPRECEALEPSGCPGLGVIVWDPCRCCKVCARTLGENCGGFSGTCEPGLKCVDGVCNSS